MAIKLWDYLDLHCKGQARAIKQRRIASILNVSVREIRNLTNILATVYHKPVASTVHPPYGIYIPANRDEKNSYIMQLDSRIKSLFVRRKAFSRSTAVEVAAQMEFTQ